MKKVKLFGTLGILTTFTLTMSIAFYSSTNKNLNNEALCSSNWLDDYPGYEDYLVSNKKDQSLRVEYQFTDEPCIDTLYGSYFEGRWVYCEYYETNDVGQLTNLVKSEYEKWIPASIERKTIKGYYDGERDPNEWCDSLIAFLNDYVNSPTGSYESFSAYITYLEENFGMYEDEAEVWRYRWRYEHNSLTDEEKAQIEEEERQRLEEEAKREEENQKIMDILNENAQAKEKSKIDLYTKEANMIERTIPEYYHFDRELFIALRKKGLDYTKAYEQSISINFEEGFDYIGNKMEENKDWYAKMASTLTSEGVMTSIKNISNNLGGFFEELFSNSSNTSTEENTETGESM